MYPSSGSHCLYLCHCHSCMLTTFQGKWVGEGGWITCTPLCSLQSARHCPLAECVPNKQLMEEERFGSLPRVLEKVGWGGILFYLEDMCLLC